MRKTEKEQIFCRLAHKKRTNNQESKKSNQKLKVAKRVGTQTMLRLGFPAQDHTFTPISIQRAVTVNTFLLDATLLSKVSVDPDGKISITIATTALKHDVTGGVREKLQTASNIIRISEAKTRVFVTNVMSEVSAYSVCVLGVLEGKGTEIIGETEGSLAVERQ